LNLGSNRWVPLVKFGLYRHKKGIQNVNESSCQKLVDNFKASFLDKLLKKVCPVYEGHPEGEAESIGTVEELKLMKPYLMARINFKEKGLELIRQGVNKLSPVWECEAAVDGFCYPERLISLGLVQNPNIRFQTTLENEEFDLYWFDSRPTSELIDEWKASGKDVEKEILKRCTGRS